MEDREERRGSDVSAGAGAEGGARLSRIDALIRELETARSTARSIRICIMVLIVVVVLVFVGLTYRLYRQVKGNSEEYLAQIQLRMVDTADAMKRDLRGVARNVLPDYREALQAQMETTGPEIVALLAPQMELFIENVKANMDETFSERMMVMAKGQEAVIKQTFPELRDEQKVLRITKNLADALMAALSEVTMDRLLRCTDELDSVKKLTVAFLPEERRAAWEAREESWADKMETFIYPAVEEGASMKGPAK